MQKAGLEEKSSDGDKIIAQLKERFSFAERSEKVLTAIVLNVT